MHNAWLDSPIPDLVCMSSHKYMLISLFIYVKFLGSGGSAKSKITDVGKCYWAIIPCTNVLSFLLEVTT